MDKQKIFVVDDKDMIGKIIMACLGRDYDCRYFDSPKPTRTRPLPAMSFSTESIASTTAWWFFQLFLSLTGTLTKTCGYSLKIGRAHV